MKTPTQSQKTDQNNLVRNLILGLAFGLLWFIFANLPVTFKDWVDVFRPAALNLSDPFFQPGLVFNPPWLFPILYPFAILPHPWGVGLLMLLSVMVVGWYVGSPQKMFWVTISAPMVVLFSLGQLDALLLLALMIPHGLGLPFLLTKPQGVFLTALRRLNRWSILATGGIILLSVLIWGFWWQNLVGTAPNQTVNMSLFPWSIPLGLALTYWGYREDSDAWLCLASLCFAPYFMITSLLPALASAVRDSDDKRVWMALVLASWAYYLLLRLWF